jgi:hypothetical protein
MGRPVGHKNKSGGPNAPRLRNGNINWTQVYNEYILPLIRNQISPNTIRGIMYIMKNVYKVLEKSDYNTLDKHLVSWRLDGYIDWDDIADGSGRGLIGDFDEFEYPEDWIDGYIDMLKNGGEYYQDLLKKQWRWFGQPKYVEFMVEKHTVTGTIYAYIKDRYVKLSHNKGNNGWGWAYKYARKLERELYYTDIETGKIKPREEVNLWYLGDDDSYGRKMDKHLRDQLAVFGLLKRVNFKRIAVLPEQASEYGLSISDEGGGYDIDALNISNAGMFKELLHDHIDPYFDEDIHERVLEKYPEKDINDIINRKIKFLDGN